MTNQNKNAFFVVIASEIAGQSTPYDVLYGSEQVVFRSEAEAEAAAEEFNSALAWGRDGDKTGPEVGIEYFVQPCEDLDDVERYRHVA